LGHLIGNYGHVETEAIKKTVNDVNARINLLLRQFDKCSGDVKYKLFKSYCMSAYGSQLWDLSSCKVESFYVTWRKCIRRLYKLHPRSHRCLLNLVCLDETIEVQMCNRFLRFFHTAFTSDNTHVKLACQMALNGSGSSICNSINHICSKFTFSKHIFNQDVITLIHSTPDEGDLMTAGAIRDFISIRNVEQSDHVDSIVQILCTL
jgi:hypothetical protein